MTSNLACNPLDARIDLTTGQHAELYELFNAWGAVLHRSEFEGSTLELTQAGRTLYLCEADGDHWLFVE